MPDGPVPAPGFDPRVDYCTGDPNQTFSGSAPTTLLGDGKIPNDADMVECHYRGTLIDGTEFDSSYGRGKAAIFKVKGKSSPAGAKPRSPSVGSRFQFVVPPQLSYGERGAGSQIGPNTTLVFEIELLAIKQPAYRTLGIGKSRDFVGRLSDSAKQCAGSESRPTSGAYGSDRTHLLFQPSLRNRMKESIAFPGLERPGYSQWPLTRPSVFQGEYRSNRPSFRCRFCGDIDHPAERVSVSHFP